MRVLIFAFISFFVSSRADKASFQAGVGHVLQNLQTVGLNANTQISGQAAGQKMLAEHLMKSLSELDPDLDPKQFRRLRNVSSILGKVAGMLSTEKETAQGLYQLALNRFTDCSNSTLKSSESTKYGLMLTARGDHKTCRQGESTHANNADTHCNHFKTTVDDYGKDGVLTCTQDDKPADWTLGLTAAAISSEFGNWDKFFEDADTHIKSWYADVTKHGGNCTKHFNKWLKKNSGSEETSYTYTKVDQVGWHTGGCNLEQHEFEDSYCTWITALNAYCDHLTNCYSGADASFYEVEYNTFTEANQRIRDVAAVKYIKCIVDNLINNANATQAVWESGCNFTMEDYPANYNNTQLFLPGRDNCTKSDASTPRDGDSWYNQEYKNFIDNDGLNVYFVVPDGGLCPTEDDD